MSVLVECFNSKRQVLSRWFKSDRSWQVSRVAIRVVLIAWNY